MLWRTAVPALGRLPVPGHKRIDNLAPVTPKLSRQTRVMRCRPASAARSAQTACRAPAAAARRTARNPPRAAAGPAAAAAWDDDEDQEDWNAPGPAMRAALGLLEWPALCEHIAGFASTAVGKRRAAALDVPLDQATSKRLLAETRCDGGACGHETETGTRAVRDTSPVTPRSVPSPLPESCTCAACAPQSGHCARIRLRDDPRLWRHQHRRRRGGAAARRQGRHGHRHAAARPGDAADGCGAGVGCGMGAGWAVCACMRAPTCWAPVRRAAGSLRPLACPLPPPPSARHRRRPAKAPAADGRPPSVPRRAAP